MEWLSMGKYGPYVWSSFSLAAVVLVACVVQARRRHRAVLRDIARLDKLTEDTE